MLTAEQIAAAFNAAGIDTPEKLTTFLSVAAKMVALRQLDMQIEALNAERTDALYPIQQKQTALQTQRAELVASLLPS